jgi:hypothetical protein
MAGNLWARHALIVSASLLCLVSALLCARARRFSLYSDDSFVAQISRGGRQSWEGHVDTFWHGDLSTNGDLSTRSGADRRLGAGSFVPPVESMPQEGGVDITDVGEGTERVRLGLEGEWSGMSSSSRPGVDQEGGGAGWLAHAQPASDAAMPSRERMVAARDMHLARAGAQAAREEYPATGSGFGERGGFGDDYDILNPPAGQSAYPSTSSYAYPRTAGGWVSENGKFPGDLEEGTFPGVNPDDPDGTSWMIGMHRDGEETVGDWASAPRRRAGLARKQQLVLIAGGVVSDRAAGARRNAGKFKVLRAGRGRWVRAQELAEEAPVGADITHVGEDNRDRYVYGGYGNRPEPTSWVVGEHRQLHWSDSQTYACSTTSVCRKGKADSHHSFQADTNPYVDKRRVFDPYAQLDRSDHKHGRTSYPWDPTLDPQVQSRVCVCVRARVRACMSSVYSCFVSLG